MNSKTQCCLLIEDDPEDQEFFLDALHSVSANTGCYAVSNGEEALFMLQHERLSPDFIFTDVNMPRMGGLEFLKKIKRIESLQNIPVIVYSSNYSEDEAQKVKQLGALAVYCKTRISALKDILKKYFHDSREATIL
ncbi:MAG: response regulator [Cyclobacteriaceae bacterium]